jgi:hypothetical protein
MRSRASHGEVVLIAYKTDGGWWNSAIEIEGRVVSGNIRGLALIDAQRDATRLLEAETGMQVESTELAWSTDLPRGVREINS